SGNLTTPPLTPISACLGGSATFTTTPSGTAPFSYVWKKDNVVINGQTNNSLTISPVTTNSVGNYTVEIGSGCGATNSSATLTLRTNTTATALVSLALCPGATASFSTTPGGTGPFQYQWTKDGAPIANATNSAYAIASVQAGDAGQYCVTVTGNCSSVTNCAALTVVQPDAPVISCSSNLM